MVTIRCSFCDKPQNKVRLLIATPDQRKGVYICNECVGVCVSIMNQARKEDKAETTPGKRLKKIPGNRRWFEVLFDK